jgi:hypothetical protein
VLILTVVAGAVLLAVMVLQFGGPRGGSWVVVGRLDELPEAMPINYQGKAWVIRDGYGTVHAFPTLYEAPARWSQVNWHPARDPLAANWLALSRCAAEAGDGIFNVTSPGNSRYDASGRKLSGPDRARLDWYEVKIEGGAVLVDLSRVERAPSPASVSEMASDGGAAVGTPPPVVPGSRERGCEVVSVPGT